MQEDHGDLGGRGLDTSHRLFLERDDQVDPIPHELPRHGVSGRLVGQVPKVQADVSPIFVAKCSQLFPEWRQRRRHMIEANVDDPDPPDLVLALPLDGKRRGEEAEGKRAHEHPAQRFRHAHQLEAYLGLVPREYSSGETQRRGPITKAGHSRTRWLLIQAAVSILRRHPPQAEDLRTWALRIAARRGKQVAVVALARRLAGILYALLRDGTVFAPQHLRPPRPTAPALVNMCPRRHRPDDALGPVAFPGSYFA
jgi:hypothetical protein